MLRIAFTVLILVFLTPVQSATLAPVQLINPAGSSAGQAIISTGPTSAPTWAPVPLSGITGTLAITNGGTGATSAAAARTNLGLGTAAVQNMGTSGAVVPLLSTANTWALGQTFTGAIAPSQTAGITGTTTNNSANAGAVGEYLTANTQGTSLSNNVAANLTSISLTAGDWEVSGLCGSVPAGSTITVSMLCGISTVSATFQTIAGSQFNWQALTTVNTAGTGNQIIAPVTRISLAATTTIYLVGQIAFTTSTMTANGFIRARRVR